MKGAGDGLERDGGGRRTSSRGKGDEKEEQKDGVS